MEVKTLIAIIVISVFLYIQFDEYVWEYIAPRSYCKPGLVPDPENDKLCIPEEEKEPVYYQTLKEVIFLLMCFGGLTYIFTRKKKS